MFGSKEIFLAKEMLKFYIKAQTIHDIDSPFLFELIKNTIETKNERPVLHEILKLKRVYQNDHSLFTRTDFGEGSIQDKFNQKKVDFGRWVTNSSIEPLFGKILHQLVHYFQPNTILELGTAAGISGAYLASGNTTSTLYTHEGDGYLSAKALHLFATLHLKNIELITGNFDNTFKETLIKTKTIDLLFLDGNHNYNYTLKYVDTALPYLSGYKIVILDDIRWSSEMYACWKELAVNPHWNVAIDLFRIGILIYNPDQTHRTYLPVIKHRYKPHPAIFR